ncbi:cilia- and flagella-associated protein 184-like [Cochliomyia hominivorax]
MTNEHAKKDIKNAFDIQKKLYSQNDNTDSTSSSTITESTDFSINQEEDQEFTRDIFDIIYDTSEETFDIEEEDQELEDEQQKYKIDDSNFFENFSQLPDIVDVSEDLSKVDIEETIIAAQDTSKDTGYFVDPLTGLEIRPYASSAATILKDISRDTTGKEPSIAESQPSEKSDILIPAEESFEELIPTAYDLGEQQTIDLFETFMELELTKAEKPVEEVDWEAIIREEEAKELQQQTIEFINDLIHKVVVKAEYISPETILRQSLDKQKLMEEISYILLQKRVEVKVSEFLNRKVVEFFKRKQIYRPIMPENFKELQQENDKYIKTLKRLDELLGKEQKVGESRTSEVNNLRNELAETQQRVQNEVEKFDHMVRKNLVRDSSTQQYNNTLDILLQRMAKYREEVSDVRCQMIIKQHTHALLLEKIGVLDNLGNNLTMKDYDNIHTEVMRLDKKIEERNIDLKKLHQRSCHSLHFLAHFKEKYRMCIDIIETQRSNLNDLIDERSSLRKYVYNLKLKRSRIRKEINELSTQCGILDKPALMYDYDQNEKRLSELREIVNRLRLTFATIEQKINKLEKRLTLLNNQNFSLVM